MSADNGLILVNEKGKNFAVRTYQGEHDQGVIYDTDSILDALAFVERELSPDINTGMPSYEYGVTIKGFRKGTQWEEPEE